MKKALYTSEVDSPCKKKGAEEETEYFLQQHHCYWNLAKLLGISFRKTSTCFATILNFMSSAPLVSCRRIPLPYNTVKSGRISPSATSHRGPILQCYDPLERALAAWCSAYLANDCPLSNFCADFNDRPFSNPPCFHNCSNLYHNAILDGHTVFLII